MYAGCRCPRCPEDRVLKTTETEGHKVLSCRRCGGVFVGVELGLRLLAVLRADVPPLDEDDPHIACPVCRAAMRRALPKGVDVKVEVCRRHGVWFDDDDLVIVARAVARALGKPVPDAVASLASSRAAVPASASPAAASPATMSSPASGAAPGGSPTTSRSGSTPAPTGGGQHRFPTFPGAASPRRSEDRLGDTALDVVEAVGEATITVVEVVTLPAAVGVAIVGGLIDLFD